MAGRPGCLNCERSLQRGELLSCSLSTPHLAPEACPGKAPHHPSPTQTIQHGTTIRSLMRDLNHCWLQGTQMCRDRGLSSSLFWPKRDGLKGLKCSSLTLNLISRVILDNFYGTAEFMIQNGVGKSFIKHQGCQGNQQAKTAQRQELYITVTPPLLSMTTIPKHYHGSTTRMLITSSTHPEKMGADCGEGVSRREVSCVVHWGSLSGPPQPVPVEDQMCVGNSQKVSETELLQLCAIPCPGECHLTKWSQWSSCQLLCLDGRSFETWGRQARSRAVVTQVPENQDSCPSQMYETRPCRGGTCLSYEWMSGEWRHNRRLVWCQRSDGVNVTGGCIAQNQPSAVRQCHPPCTKPFSFCTQNGVCGCEKGFTEVMTSYGFLDYCTRTPGLDHRKADVKTTTGRLRPEHARNKNHIKDWVLQPLGPDGRVKLWVYGLMAGGFVVILLLIIMSFLLCKNPEDSPSSSPQKALALAYDGDVDM
ncbi:thrombospondin type-1 domain-containing protein 7B-like [Garra rufa]|uniref:thrombospondin type-1 domain-containing protein 7B-like n=1 Tax=Garra rufa TaxID=137080 RepID=UPI003CCEBCB0